MSQTQTQTQTKAAAPLPRPVMSGVDAAEKRVAKVTGVVSFMALALKQKWVQLSLLVAVIFLAYNMPPVRGGKKTELRRSPG